MQILNPYHDLNRKDIILTIVLMGFAFIVPSYFGLPIYGSINLYFGSIFTFIAILTLPMRFSLLVMIVNVVSMYSLLSIFVFSLILATEYFVVYYLIRRNLNPLMAVSLFWFVFGFPSLFSIFFLIANENVSTALFTSLTVGLNGFVCGVFALLVYRLIPIRSQFRRAKSKPRKYSAVVLELCLLIVLVPTILVALFFTWRSTTDTEANISNELRSATVQLQQSLSQRLEHNRNTVASVAARITSLEDVASHQMILNAVAESNQDIESMLIVDKQGDVLLAAPGEYSDYLKNNRINMSSREYFQQTIDSEKSVVSSVVVSQGQKEQAIIASTSPIIVQKNTKGLVQAAIWLNRLIDLKVLESIESTQSLIIITDARDQVIYSSAAFGFTPRDTFVPKSSLHPFVRFSPVADINGLPFMFEQNTNEFGWQFYALASPDKVFDSILNYFTIVSLILLLSFLLVAFLSRSLAESITKPLVNLEKFIAGQLNAEQLLSESKVSSEMIKVSENLIDTYRLSQEFSEQLKLQVDVQTKELTELNHQLYKMAKQDALTDLLNRGAFDNYALATYKTCRRNKLAYTIVLIDIDYFKKINDNFGHAAGDKCIQHVAQRLKETFVRENDIVARYGGEEYIVMSTGTTHDTHLAFLKKVHQRLSDDFINYEGKSIPFTVSCGMVSVETDFSLSLEQTIALADEQMYISKSQGRDRISSIKC